ncbi:MAG TPA: T9SS type A sorting domain-containing protein [Flavobacteriales bacterium]|nr:T9SS type A sorting domain-containing protein [Flavobacteriales bacterium]
MLARFLSKFLERFLFTLLLLWSLAASAQQDNECGANAGSCWMEYGPVCLVNGQAIISATPNGDAVVPPGFATAYLLSRTNSLILEQVGPTPNFAVTTADVWRIHTLVFDPATFDPSDIQYGVTSAYDLAAQFTQHGGPICAHISFTVPGGKSADCDAPCLAFAPQLSIDSTTVCLVDGEATLTATSNGAEVLPDGFVVRYLLSRTNSLIIDQVSNTPSFTVNSVDVWRLHALVYDPNTIDLDNIATGTTSIYGLAALFLQGGGHLCGSLQVGGAFVKTGDCQPSCQADAGSMVPVQPDLCLTDGMAIAAATPDGTSNVPPSFTMAYLLSANGVILATSAGAEFSLFSLGQFRIHAFAYDPATFDLAGIAAGETTLAGLEAQLVQGGGGICASLDMAGAAFEITDCVPACDADAGAMAGEAQTLCLEEGVAWLSGISYGDTVVPPGFHMGYLLSQGPDLVLMGWNEEPLFAVEATGTYHIHAFVNNPATLNTGTFDWGEMTVLDLNGLLLQGGGTICGGLDVLGASFTVEDCPPPCNGAGEDSTITVCYTDAPFQLFDFLGGNPCPGGTWTNPANPVVSGTFDPASDAAGPYTYTIIGPDGTMYMAVVTVNVLECPSGNLQHGTATKDEALGAGVSIWPNPASSELHVALPFTPQGPLDVQLVDASGRRVSARVVTYGAGMLTLDVRTLPSGLWAVHATDGTQVHVAKFMR